MKTIYIAGPISGIPGCFARPFNETAEKLRQKGWQVLNPVDLPKGWSESAYMDVCLAYVRNCNAVLMLDGWENSTGATCERALAIKCCKDVFYDIKNVPAVVL